MLSKSVSGYFKTKKKALVAGPLRKELFFVFPYSVRKLFSVIIRIFTFFIECFLIFFYLEFYNKKMAFFGGGGFQRVRGK